VIRVVIIKIEKIVSEMSRGSRRPVGRMPSRVAAVCVTASSCFRPGTGPVVTSPLLTRQLHVPTQTTLLSTPKRTVSPSSLHLSHRHQHHLTTMDAALAKIFVSNSQWVKAVNSAEPGFFEESAKGQTPKVRAITTSLLPPRAAMAASWEKILFFPFTLYLMLIMVPVCTY
jgi:hypothetical protein